MATISAQNERIRDLDEHIHTLDSAKATKSASNMDAENLANSKQEKAGNSVNFHEQMYVAAGTHVTCYKISSKNSQMKL